MTSSSRLFLAHASEDKPSVRQLYHELKERGFEPWLDTEDLVGGQNWKVEIPKAIQNAAVFLACLSGHSIAKMGYVQNEFRLALNALAQRPQEQIYLIPIRLEDCRVPDLRNPELGLSMGDHHWVDLFADDGVDRLVRALKYAGITPASSAPPAEPFRFFRDIDAPWCPEMVVIPAGRFVRGSPTDESSPQLFVTFAEPFALGRYPVTFEEYDHFCETTGRHKPDDWGWGRGRLPVINVSWSNARAYAAWIGQATGKAYRLPSEAEWEYACRAGTSTAYWWGETFDPAMANCGDGGPGRTTEVGSYPANPWGLFDMLGNVWEWQEDIWHESLFEAPDDGSAWLESNSGDYSQRVIRGGFWAGGLDVCRSATRSRHGRAGLDSDYGFRIARTLS